MWTDAPANGGGIQKLPRTWGRHPEVTQDMGAASRSYPGHGGGIQKLPRTANNNAIRIIHGRDKG